MYSRRGSHLTNEAARNRRQRRVAPREPRVPFVGREAFCICEEFRTMSKTTRKRLLTGLRPTGKFHLGNYVGTFEKDYELQESGEYDCFFLIADFHTLTTGY